MKRRRSHAEPVEDPFLPVEVMERYLLPALHGSELRALYCACRTTLAIKSKYGWQDKLAWAATYDSCTEHARRTMRIITRRLEPDSCRLVPSFAFSHAFNPPDGRYKPVAAWEDRLLPVSASTVCTALRSTQYDARIIWTDVLKAWTLCDNPIAGYGAESVGEWLANAEALPLKFALPCGTGTGNCITSFGPTFLPPSSHLLYYVRIGIASCGAVVDARATDVCVWPNV